MKITLLNIIIILLLTNICSGGSYISPENPFTRNVNHHAEPGFRQTEISNDVFFNVRQNYPNPFSPVTVFKYELSISDFLILTVYDASGKGVAALVKEMQQPGSYWVEWDGLNYPGGVFNCKSCPGSYEQTQRMV